MSLSQHLMPSNSAAAKSTAHNAFLRFLKDEGVTLEEVHRSISSTRDGSGIAVVMDKFAIHLAFSPSQKGERLAKNTVDSYFGQVKLWILACYPELRAIAQPAVDAVGARLKKYCTKRSGGSIVQRAPACRKSDLRILLRTVYQYGSSTSDYLDGLLLVWLWHLFGRSSDLNSVSTRNLSIYPGGALFVQFVRPKTADEIGLSLYRDQDFVTCPINALALGMIMKTSANCEIFTHIPRSDVGKDEDVELLNVPLRDLLNAQVTDSRKRRNGAGVQNPPPSVHGVASPSVHGYVNRLIEALSKRAGVTEIRKQLTSHSFRRGGAQDANGSAKLSAQWILDRGSWSMFR